MKHDRHWYELFVVAASWITVLIVVVLAIGTLYGQELKPLEAPTTDSAWTAYRRPTDATELATRLRQLRRYCAAGRGLAFGTPALFRDPQGRLVAAFSHPTFAAPHRVVRDAEGNIVSESGGDKILLVRGKALIKAALQLCAPDFRDGRRERRFLREFWRLDQASGNVRFVRKLPAGLKPAETHEHRGTAGG